MIRREVIDEVLVRTLWLSPWTAVEVAVYEGVVTLTGHVERRSEAEIAASSDRPDRRSGRGGRQADLPTGRLAPAARRAALHGVAEEWLRKL